MDAEFIVTLGADEEYALPVPFAFANELPSAVFLSASPFTVLSVEVAVAPGATAEVDVETAVAGWVCAGILFTVSVIFSVPPVCPSVNIEPPGCWDASYQFSYTSGITVWDNSILYQTGIWFTFATANGGEFDLVSINISEGNGNLNTVEILGYRDGVQVATDTPISLTTAGTTNFQTISLPSAFDNVDWCVAAESHI